MGRYCRFLVQRGAPGGLKPLTFLLLSLLVDWTRVHRSKPDQRSFLGLFNNLLEFEPEMKSFKAPILQKMAVVRFSSNFTGMNVSVPCNFHREVSDQFCLVETQGLFEH